MKETRPDRILALLPPIDGEIYSDEEMENAVVEGLMSRIEARELSGGISVKGEATGAVPAAALPVDTLKDQLELATSVHVSRAGAQRQAKLRKPRRARTSREKLAADQPPESQRPPEWDESRR